MIQTLHKIKGKYITILKPEAEYSEWKLVAWNGVLILYTIFFV